MWIKARADVISAKEEIFRIINKKDDKALCSKEEEKNATGYSPT